MKKILYYIRIAGVLLLISAAIAGMLAAVNALTGEKIAAGELATKTAAIREELFTVDGDLSVKDVTERVKGSDTVKEILAVYCGDEFLGYAVSVTGAGYGGSIELLVGIAPDGGISGVAVTSHSETKGLTEEATEKEFLAGFKDSADGTVDKMAGATVSSRAVTDAVNRAVALGLKGEIK
ncbi:MAG: FMN-binding protein [Clostridia bacterium]|nr:FMN-binding protein [Clostridia bacterium]